MKPLRIISVAVCVLFAAATMHAATEETVAVSGVVKDANGNPAAGISIKFYRLRPPSTGMADKFSYPVYVAESKDRGEWEIKLPPRTYRYLAGSRAVGYSGGSLTVTREKPETLDIQLSAPEQK